MDKLSNKLIQWNLNLMMLFHSELMIIVKLQMLITYLSTAATYKSVFAQQTKFALMTEKLEEKLLM
jgi:hypothetical protein